MRFSLDWAPTPFGAWSKTRRRGASLATAPTSLPGAKKESAVLKLVAQFANPIVLTLLVAAVIAIVNGASQKGTPLLARFGDATAILLIVVLNAVLGFVQERRAEAALDALAEDADAERAGAARRQDRSHRGVAGRRRATFSSSKRATPCRPTRACSRRSTSRPKRARSPAKARRFRKTPEPPSPTTRRSPTAPTMLFVGTTLVRGKGRAVVVATGARTELGQLSALIHRPRDRTTPLEEKLDWFGKRILWACLALVGAALRARHVQGRPQLARALLEAVSLAVAAIPEGLPAITTITLALGMQRMAKRGAIVRKLAAVETLGAATVICSDKTGTLTQNADDGARGLRGRRALRRHRHRLRPAGRAIVAGTGTQVAIARASARATCSPTAALCNNATLDTTSDGAWRVQRRPDGGRAPHARGEGGVPHEVVVSSHQVVQELPSTATASG